MRQLQSVLLVLLFFVGSFSGCIESPTITEEEEDILFIPKTYDSKTKSFDDSGVSPYSCLISTLVNDEEDHNYWNESFWIKLPASLAKEGEEETILEAFVFGDQDAGPKARSYGEFEKVVRVAQCRIPNSEKVKKKLEKRFRKFGKKSWLDQEPSSGKKKANDASGGGNTVNDWVWVCAKYFVTVVCNSSTNSCTVTDIRCISWELEFQDDGGGGGGGGFPSDDPGECDPMSTDPCVEDDGGGTPAEPDPCNELNPPVYCSNPCTTGDQTKDHIGIQGVFETLWEFSNTDLPIAQRVEQGGFITQDPASGDYGFVFVDGAGITKTACGIDGNFQAPVNTIAYVHTHPFFNGEDTRPVCGSEGEASYTSSHSFYDLTALQIFAAQTGNNFIKGYVLDGNNIITYDITTQPGLGTINSRCGY